MDDKVGLVFSWDPRTSVWVKERGPDDAARPPAAPRDDGAVQTYFLDPTNGRWQPTILGLKGRQIAAELKSAYRAAAVAGLALPEPEEAPTPEEHRSSRVPLIAGAAALLVLVGGGAFMAQAVMNPASSGPTSSAASRVTPTAESSAMSSSAPTPSATEAPTAAPTQRPVTRTPAPTAPPAPATITLSGRTASGVSITYTGPNTVQQNAFFDAAFIVIQPNGVPSGDTLNVKLGAGTVANARTDGSGKYTATVAANVPKGDQILTVFYGNTGAQVTLGTLTVR